MWDSSLIVMLIIFTLTVIFMLWRPFDINETIPTTIGAVLVLMIGIVSWSDVIGIIGIISGPSLTILSTIMMSIVLESIGFFKWVAINIVKKSRGSGIRLYIYTNLLCFLMTVLFNNDGSILITTPIIIRIIQMLKFKPHQMLPYLISGALIATSASAPIAVSNISNLIALEIVGLSLNSYVTMMFVPSMLGIFVIALLLYTYFKKDIPPHFSANFFQHMPLNSNYLYTHPLDTSSRDEEIDWYMFKVCLIIVVATRVGFFILTPYGISIEWIGLFGAFILMLYRWVRKGIGILDVVKESPWHIFLFAFNMYVLVYGLNNVGFNEWIAAMTEEYVMKDAIHATFVMGIVTSVLSNLVNNLPAVMIGTMSIMDMELDPLLLQITYLANVIGSDIGALLTPIGTLATLIWMFILKKYGVKISWGQYVKVTILIIPVGLIISLVCLYVWVIWVV
ncbi:arsenic transporter [Lysinibacillus odysseyi]|uniref:Arsenic transporter n=1 Tax=Lysinibacillus odysseyi 34hs-1 = NBRC 100172 TaxID=1220589 RepID=A0A0A3JBQ2_9BACI|nr:arsenic transporter [Lysinibacillus odysseyi]KGR84457.1 arsenic transporter [Lysinibacillus odysseyi 34hs-1 = NBRC 100172]